MFDTAQSLGDIKPVGFLLKKPTHGRYLDAFKLKPVKTDYFRSKLALELIRIGEQVNKGEIRMVDFDDENADDENTISVMDVEKYQSVKTTIAQIFQQSASNPIDSLKTMQRAKFSAMVFTIPQNKSVIALDNVSIFYKNAFEKFGLVAGYDEDGLGALGKDSALVFKYGLPCIYFEEKKRLLIIDSKRTEDMFSLLEHYQAKGNMQFTELSQTILTLDNAVLQAELKNITTARRISRMIDGKLFSADIALYKRHEAFIKSRGIDDKLVQIEISGDRVVVDTKEKFKAFLHVTSLNLVNPVLAPDQYYLALRKLKIEAKQKTR
jgi:hypothetical protein